MTKEENAEAAGQLFETALLKAAQSLERELTRIVRTGEEDIERLARRLADVLASAAIDHAVAAVFGEAQSDPSITEGALGSTNQIAAAVARAAVRGARFR
jgi:hypothetical protein